MHTWSSRLLKPKLQAAILQVTGDLSREDRLEAQVNRTPIPPSIDDANPSTSSAELSHRTTPNNQPVTPERHSTLAIPHIDTPTPSSSPANWTCDHNNQGEATAASQVNNAAGTNNSDQKTTGTPGLFGRSTAGGGLFGGRSSYGFGSTTSTATGFDLRPQNASTKTPIVTDSDNHTNSSFSSSPRATPGCSSTSSFGSSSTPGGFGSSTSNGFGLFGGVRSSGGDVPVFGSTSTSTGFGGGIGVSNRAEPSRLSNSSSHTMPSNASITLPPPGTEQTGMRDLTAAFGLTRLDDTVNKICPGTAITPFSAHIEEDGEHHHQHVQAVTSQSTYASSSLEELRLADYSHGRRSGLFGNTPDHTIDSSRTKGKNSSNESFGAPKPQGGGLFGTSAPTVRRKSRSQPPAQAPTVRLLEHHERSDTNRVRNDSFRAADRPTSSTPTRPSRRLADFLDDDDDFEDGMNDWIRWTNSGARLLTPVSGERLLNLYQIKKIIGGLDRWEKDWILVKLSRTHRNPNGTYSVPLGVVVKHINSFLDPADRIY
jgi:hypothetical protein